MAIALTESRLRQIVREEAQTLLDRQVRKEAYRRGGGGGGVTRRSNNEDDQIAHIMRERGVNYARAEQILTDIYDDVGHDDGLVANAVYGHPMDYDED